MIWFPWANANYMWSLDGFKLLAFYTQTKHFESGGF